MKSYPHFKRRASWKSPRQKTLLTVRAGFAIDDLLRRKITLIDGRAELAKRFAGDELDRASAVWATWHALGTPEVVQ